MQERQLVIECGKKQGGWERFEAARRPPPEGSGAPWP
jgi:hypothetical protein